PTGKYRKSCSSDAGILPGEFPLCEQTGLRYQIQCGCHFMTIARHVERDQRLKDPRRRDRMRLTPTEPDDLLSQGMGQHQVDSGFRQGMNMAELVGIDECRARACRNLVGKTQRMRSR